MIKLFMSGFPLDIDELYIARLIAPHGNLETIKIVRDRKSGKCKGYAFIEMTDECEAKRAISALNGSPSVDRTLTLKIAVEPQIISSPSNRIDQKAQPFYTKVSRAKEPAKKKRPRKIFSASEPSHQ